MNTFIAILIIVMLGSPVIYGIYEAFTPNQKKQRGYDD